MATIAYLRVSKDSQDVRNQRLAILEFARQERREIGEFMEVQISSRRSPRNASSISSWRVWSQAIPSSSAS